VNKSDPFRFFKVSHSNLQQGFLAVPVIILIVIGLIGAGLYMTKPWQKFTQPEVKKPMALVQPRLDMARARQLTIDPSRDTVMQITSQDNVRITLNVPKGTIKEKTTIKLIPFLHDKNATSPTAGVMVSPASINFSKPVTLSFDFSSSESKNSIPKKSEKYKVVTTGLSQVSQLDKDATSLTPTLIARGLESQRYLPARILTGGAYVYSVDGANQVEIAKKALDTPNMHSLTIIESATILLFNNQKLSDQQLTKAKGAVTKILSKKDPPASEMFAALLLQKKIMDQSFALVPVAYALETGEGFFQAACKSEGLSIEAYVGYAQSAQLMGHESAGEGCMTQAKNIVTKEAKKVLSDPNADVKSVLIAIQNIQVLGLDDETNLDEQLTEKAKEVAVKDAKKVADDPNSTPLDAAKQMQKLEALGVEEGPTYDKLTKKVREATEKFDEFPSPPPELDAEATIDEEDILNNAAMSALGVGMMKAMGWDSFDEETVRKKIDEMSEATLALKEAAAAMCAEFGDQECLSKLSQVDGMIAQARSEGYRAASELGNVQSKDYEEPEYKDDQGPIELYFEPTPTPDPEGEGNEIQEVDDTQDEGESQAGDQNFNIYQSSEDTNNGSGSEEDR
jgi:hypothetical protein